MNIAGRWKATFCPASMMGYGMVTCPDCGLEEEDELVQAAALDVEDEVSLPVPPSEAGPAAMVPVRTLVASTLIGIAAGVAIGQLTRRR